MSKRLNHSLEGMVNAMFKDMAYTYTSVNELERDRKRSLHELAVRGEQMFTKLLPAVRKHFDKCLEEGMFTQSGLYLSGRSGKRSVLPVFLRDLTQQIFDVDGKLKEQPNVAAIADFRQFCDILAKLKTVCEERYVNEEVNNFVINEQELRSPNLNWEGDDLFTDASPSRPVSFVDDFHHRKLRGQLDLFPEECAHNLHGSDAQTLQRVCDFVAAQFGYLHSEVEGDFPELPKQGPGRVSNLRKSESKYSFPFWSNKLDQVFPYDFYATHNLGAWKSEDDFTYSRVEHPSKLIAVPKTATGPRLIASEPVEHQWIQQLIRNQLERRVKDTVLRHCITFGDQRPNQFLALSGSANGFYATVDLKSASDRLSCWTIERALRSNVTLLERIHASRTRTMVNAINGSFDRILLKKCFTQGSACTFPVQTIVYSMVAISAILIAKGSNVSHASIQNAAKLCCVFGDDIIVPNYALVKLRDILQFLQLKVNPNKTFHKGRFRESCGIDAYAGVDVTPARIRSLSLSPSHEISQSMLESANNLHLRGLWHTAEWLMSHLQELSLPIEKYRGIEVRLRKTTDSYSLPATGRSIISFSGTSLDHLKKRWHKGTHENQVMIHRLVSKSVKNLTNAADDLLEFHTQRRSPPNRLSYLVPLTGGLGVVDKTASVMRRGWVPTSAFGA